MADRSEKGSVSEEVSNNKCQDGFSSEESQSQSQAYEVKKTCADCGTTKTPLWRGGPAGPKSLCNACGIRSRKKRRAFLATNKPEDKKSKRNHKNNERNSNNSLGDSLKRRLLEIGREAMLHRSTVDKQSKKLGEEEQAAVLLMALSYGSVYA